jgi:hypothetical protein
MGSNLDGDIETILTFALKYGTKKPSDISFYLCSQPLSKSETIRQLDVGCWMLNVGRSSVLLGTANLTFQALSLR